MGRAQCPLVDGRLHRAASRGRPDRGRRSTRRCLGGGCRARRPRVGLGARDSMPWSRRRRGGGRCSRRFPPRARGCAARGGRRPVRHGPGTARARRRPEAGTEEAGRPRGDPGCARRIRTARGCDLGREGSRRARTHRRSHARGGADARRAPRRRAGRRGPHEPGGRRGALRHGADGRQSLVPCLCQARRAVANRARPPAAREYLGARRISSSDVSYSADWRRRVGMRAEAGSSERRRNEIEIGLGFLRRRRGHRRVRLGRPGDATDWRDANGVRDRKVRFHRYGRQDRCVERGDEHQGSHRPPCPFQHDRAGRVVRVAQPSGAELRDHQVGDGDGLSRRRSQVPAAQVSGRDRDSWTRAAPSTSCETRARWTS